MGCMHAAACPRLPLRWSRAAALRGPRLRCAPRRRRKRSSMSTGPSSISMTRFLLCRRRLPPRWSSSPRRLSPGAGAPPAASLWRLCPADAPYRGRANLRVRPGLRGAAAEQCDLPEHSQHHRDRADQPPEHDRAGCALGAAVGAGCGCRCRARCHGSACRPACRSPAARPHWPPRPPRRPGRRVRGRFRSVSPGAMAPAWASYRAGTVPQAAERCPEPMAKRLPAAPLGMAVPPGNTIPHRDGTSCPPGRGSATVARSHLTPAGCAAPAARHAGASAHTLVRRPASGRR